MNKNNLGFSLLELVVAVGILLILTVSGLLAYNGITENARQAAANQSGNSQPADKKNENNSDNGFGNGDQPGPETNEDREKNGINK